MFWLFLFGPCVPCYFSMRRIVRETEGRWTRGNRRICILASVTPVLNSISLIVTGLANVLIMLEDSEEVKW